MSRKSGKITVQGNFTYIYTHTRTHVALPQRQGFLRDIKFLINRISGSKVEERRKKAGRKDAQARPRKPLERDFRRGARDTRAEGGGGGKRGGEIPLATSVSRGSPR